jgi:hypothetical protein
MTHPSEGKFPFKSGFLAACTRNFFARSAKKMAGSAVNPDYSAVGVKLLLPQKAFIPGTLPTVGNR